MINDKVINDFSKKYIYFTKIFRTFVVLLRGGKPKGQFKTKSSKSLD